MFSLCLIQGTNSIHEFIKDIFVCQQILCT